MTARRSAPRHHEVCNDAVLSSAGAASRLAPRDEGARERKRAMPDAKMGRSGAAPHYTELLARAEALIPVLRERAARAEELRRIPDETIADLHSSGLFRMLQPARVGGSELPYRALFELTAVIGRGCGSTAWVLANLAAHHWLLGMWHPEAQEEIWGQSPDCLISSALVFPRGRARRVEGGYRLSGRWPFSSGIDPSSWNMFGAVVSDEETGENEPRMFLVPTSQGPSAIAATLVGRRANNAVSQGRCLVPWILA